MKNKTMLVVLSVVVGIMVLGAVGVAAAVLFVRHQREEAAAEAAEQKADYEQKCLSGDQGYDPGYQSRCAVACDLGSAVSCFREGNEEAQTASTAEVLGHATVLGYEPARKYVRKGCAASGQTEASCKELQDFNKKYPRRPGTFAP